MIYRNPIEKVGVDGEVDDISKNQWILHGVAIWPGTKWYVFLQINRLPLN